MFKDRKIGPQPPRMQFTFWPYNSEAELIGKMSTEQLVEHIVQPSPELLPQTLHELWRTHRDEEIRPVLELSENNPRALNTLEGEDMSSVIAVGTVFKGQAVESFRPFLEKVLTIREEIALGDDGQELTVETQDRIKNKVSDQLQEVEEKINIFRSNI